MATAVAARPSAQSRYCGLSTRLVTMSPSTRASARSAPAWPAVGGPTACGPAAGGGRRQARSAAAAKNTRTRASPAEQTATATSRPAVATSIAPYWCTGGGPMPKARATMNGVAATDSTCKPRACWNARKAVAPFMVARAFGIGPPPVHQYGAMEVATAGRDVAVAVCSAGEALVLVFFAAAALRAWRRPPPAAGPQAVGPPTAGQAGADRALALVLGLMVTSRVLSPQYLLWALGLAATAVAMGSRRQRTTAVLLLVAAAASHLVYPVLYGGVLSGRPLPTPP